MSVFFVGVAPGLLHESLEVDGMITDMGPIVQRLLQQFVLAGVPTLMVVSCSGGRDTINMDLGGSGGGSVGGSGGGSVGGSGGGGSGGNTRDGGADAAGGHQACQSLGVTCGSPTCTGQGGNGPQVYNLPLDHATAAFDPDDPRLVDLYRACVAEMTSATCGPDCRGLCRAVLQTDGGFINDQAYLKCDVTCGATAQVNASFSGTVCGRRPNGSLGARCRAGTETPLGRLLAQAAELEAASVPAFRRVAAELTAHDAPAPLVHAARTAMVDEARHWRRTRNLARRRGGDPIRPTVTRAPASSLLEMAVDNVIEGCVRETYGALVAMHQAETAHDVDVRVLMTDIARDEMNHAALSWRIDAWAASKLAPSFQRRRSEAARAALNELALATRIPIDETIRTQAGLPTPDAAAQLLGRTWTSLWRPAFSL